MSCWASLLRYLEHDSDYSFIVRTLAYAGPDIARNLINVLPIFAGFAVIGYAIFWNGYRFATLDMACFTLFALANGDEISNTYTEV